MGERNDGKHEQPTRPAPGSTLPAAPGKRPERPAGNPRPGNSAAAADPGTGVSGTPAGTGTPEKEKKLSGLAPVTDPAAPPAPEPPKKKQTRKKRTTKKDESGFSSEQITALIVSISSIAASRPNMEVWALSEVEAKQIADPLANMLAKSEKLQNAGEYADAIALVTACLVIFVPRFLLWTDLMKQKKIEANGGVTLVRKETKSTGNSGKSVKPNADHSKNDADSIFASIPASIY